MWWDIELLTLEKPKTIYIEILVEGPLKGFFGGERPKLSCNGTGQTRIYDNSGNQQRIMTSLQIVSLFDKRYAIWSFSTISMVLNHQHKLTAPHRDQSTKPRTWGGKENRRTMNNKINQALFQKVDFNTYTRSNVKYHIHLVEKWILYETHPIIYVCFSKKNWASMTNIFSKSKISINA